MLPTFAQLVELFEEECRLLNNILRNVRESSGNVGRRVISDQRIVLRAGTPRRWGGDDTRMRSNSPWNGVRSSHQVGLRSFRPRKSNIEIRDWLGGTQLEPSEAPYFPSGTPLDGLQRTATELACGVGTTSSWEGGRGAEVVGIILWGGKISLRPEGLITWDTIFGHIIIDPIHNRVADPSRGAVVFLSSAIKKF
ncbi:hypothetical protein EVAR_40581_1 [Eumeta japonica]|uniref:Uncharacterized protein n=1 Tax=Eumeta variegata TaxID=151549 RepID=A0A4C1VWF8_EUMVA|nr:hypothetical protein EVAR_40581_1 [Eumeta japonica]